MTDRIVKVTLRGEVTDLVGKFKVASSATDDLRKRMLASTREGESFRQNLSAVGDTAGRMGLALTAGAGLAVKAAIDWESAWAGVTKTVDGSAAQMSQLEDGLRGLARTLPSTHEEIAAVAEAAGQLGVARQDIVSFTKTMLDLSQTTNLSADEAATSIAQFANVMGTSGADIDNLGATLVALGNDGASTERDIIQMAQRIAGAAKTVGLSEGEVLAFANTVASMGIDVEAGGTAVSTVFATMARAASSGGAKLESFAKTAGVSAEEFAASFKTAPAEAMVSFIQGLERTQQAGGNLYAQLDAVGLQDVRVSQALIGMASSGDLLTDSLKLQSTSWRENTALIKEAEKRYDTTAARASIAWNNIKDNAIDAAQGILPVVSTLAEGVSGLGQAFGELPGPIKSTFGAVAGVGGAALLASAGMIKLSSAIVAQRNAMVALGIATPASATAIAGLSRAAIGATSALAGLYAAHVLLEKDQTKGVQRYTKELLGLAGGSMKAKAGIDDLFKVENSDFAWITASKKQINGLDDAFRSIDTNVLEDIGNFGSSLFGVWSDKGDLAADAFNKADAALEGLVTSGAADQAGEAFDYLADSADRNGVSIKALNNLFPRYNEALLAAENQGKLTSDTIKEIGDATNGAQQDVDAFAQSMKKLLDPALDQDAAANAWKDSLASLTEELKKNGNTLDDRTVKGRANQNAIRDRVQALKDSVAADEAAGGSSEELAAKLQRGARKILDTADAANLSRKEVKKYLEQLNLTPEEIDTLLTVKTNGADEAKRVIRELQTALDNINPFKDVYIRTHRSGDDAGNEARARRATGGSVIGAGTATSDSIPALLSNGEHVWTAAEVKAAGGQDAVYRMRAMVMSGMAPRYAAGGAVSKASRLEIKQAQAQVRDIEQSLSEKETIKRGGKKQRRLVLRGLDREIAQLQLAEAKKELRDLKNNQAAKDEARDLAAQAAEDAAAGRLSAKNSVLSQFSLTDSASPLDVSRKIQRLIANASEFTSLLASLKKKGASPWLLAQLVEAGPTGSAIRLARQYDNDSAALASINAQASVLDRTAGSYASLISDPRFAAAGAWNAGYAAPAPQQPLSTPLVLDGVVVGTLLQVAGQAARIEVVKNNNNAAIEARLL